MAKFDKYHWYFDEIGLDKIPCMGWIVTDTCHCTTRYCLLLHMFHCNLKTCQLGKLSYRVCLYSNTYCCTDKHFCQYRIHILHCSLKSSSFGDIFLHMELKNFGKCHCKASLHSYFPNNQHSIHHSLSTYQMDNYHGKVDSSFDIDCHRDKMSLQV